MRKVLKISYYFPPYDWTQSLEASKFTKYLPDHGWEPIVISAVSDFPPTLPVEIPSESIHRTRQWDLNRLPKMLVGRERLTSTGFVTSEETRRGRMAARAGFWYRQLVDFPDAQIGWYPFALKKARKLIEEIQPEAIFTSAWPITNHLVASTLVKETGLPWLADFRDLWTANHNFRRIRGLRTLEEHLERRVMDRASVLSAPTETWVEWLRQRFDRPAFLLPNGFDPDDYPDETPEAPFTLTYTGVFYPGKQDPSPLLNGLVLLREQGIISADSFRFRLRGRYVEYFREELVRRGLDDLADIQGFVPRTEALGLQKRASALLFLLWARSEGRGWYSAKLYEYLGAGRPILAIGDEQMDAARLISEIGGGKVVNTPQQVADTLAGWLTGNETAPKADESALMELQWSSITKRLAEALDEISG